jgi:hypothetical protein
VAAIYAARARRDAVERNRTGECDEAARLLDGVRQRILSYAGTDEELKRIAATLESERGVFSSVMDAASLKIWHQGSIAALRARDVGGRARRQPNPDR